MELCNKFKEMSITTGFPRFIGWFASFFGGFPYFFGAFPRFFGRFPELFRNNKVFLCIAPDMC